MPVKNLKIEKECKNGRDDERGERCCKRCLGGGARAGGPQRPEGGGVCIHSQNSRKAFK